MAKEEASRVFSDFHILYENIYDKDSIMLQDYFLDSDLSERALYIQSCSFVRSFATQFSQDLFIILFWNLASS